MTVCIATLYGNGDGCVLASDQMITAHFPIGYEFESSEVEKIIKINDSVVARALIAGDIIFANEVIEETRKQVNSEGATAIDKIAELLRRSYQTIRRNHIVRKELEPRGLDLGTYYQNHQTLLPQLVQLIDNQFKTFNPRVEFIIAGKGESACHIYTVNNPGDLFCHDCVGYAAIGSGAPHAIYSLIDSDYKKSFDKEEAEKIIKKAKERSEVAPGVGEAVTVVTI